MTSEWTPRPPALQIEGALIRITGRGRTPVTGRVLSVNGPYKPNQHAPWLDVGGWSIIYEQVEPTHLAGQHLYLNQVRVEGDGITATGGIDRIEVIGGAVRQLRLF